MKTETEEIETISEKRIDSACSTFKKVHSTKNEKFKSLDIWLKKEAKIYLKETEYVPKSYMKYKKGTIIKADFGINIGSELSNSHFAIIMDNNDNYYKETVSVIPLTSKGGVGKTDLGTLIFDEFIKKMNKEIDNLDNSKNFDEDVKEIKELIKEYKKYRKLTYANISQFRCISKNRIIYPKNKHDLIGKTKVSKDIIEKLSVELMMLYC